MNNILSLIRAYYEASGVRDPNFKKYAPAARKLLARCDGDMDYAIEMLRAGKRWFESRDLKWSLLALVRHFHEIQPSNKENEKITKVDKGLTGLGDIMREKSNMV